MTDAMQAVPQRRPWLAAVLSALIPGSGQAYAGRWWRAAVWFAPAMLALVGAVNVPIIHSSVEWWSSLHQGPTLIKEGGPAMDTAMLYPLLAMIFGFTLLFGSMLLRRVRAEVLFRERRTRWVKEMVLAGGSQ